MSKEFTHEYEKVEVVVNVITKPGLVLTIFNEKWGAFTLPMSKLRKHHDPLNPEDVWIEDRLDAAIRVAGELRGRTFTKGEFPKYLYTTTEMRQSDRTGEYKLYTFHVFQMDLHPNERLRENLIVEWLEKDSILTDSVFPISPTAKFILEQP